MKNLAIVIPAFNEELRLLPTLVKVVDFLQENYPSYEIIIVSDGSSDKTVTIAEEFSESNNNIKIISYEKNRGKGFALKRGIESTNSKYILIYDADGSSPIEEVSKLFQAISNTNCSIAIGSRAKPSKDTIVQTSNLRKFIGRIYNFLINLAILPGFYDTQCGFKLYEANIAKKLFALSKIDGFSFDIEVLYLAKKKGCKISEIAINWHNVEGSKVHIIKDSLKMLFEIFKIKYEYSKGKYQLENNDNNLCLMI